MRPKARISSAGVMSSRAAFSALAQSSASAASAASLTGTVAKGWVLDRSAIIWMARRRHPARDDADLAVFIHEACEIVDEAEAFDAVGKAFDMRVGNRFTRVQIGDGEHLQGDLQDYGAGGVGLDGLLLGHWIVLSDGCQARAERGSCARQLVLLMGEGRGAGALVVPAQRRHHQQE